MAKKSEPKKEEAIAPTPIIERYASKYPSWSAWVLANVDPKYESMRKEYLK
jgi:hypothetical protein